MHEAGLPLSPIAGGWAVSGEPAAALAGIAAWLRDAKLGNGWRNELLPVGDAEGRCHAAIERGVVRPLGIATHAVHLVGIAEHGGVWVQQRSLSKATDPGLWDTTMGGLQAFGETAADTLRRETWEEAGLHLADLRDVTPIGRRTVRRPLPHGYMVEHIELVECVVPSGCQPVNQDGEVERFECIAIDALLQRLADGAFTLEAAVALVAWLQRRGVP